MNYHRNCSASGMFVLWNCGATTFMLYAADQQQRQYSRRCHSFVLSAVIRYVEALHGVYSVDTLKRAAFSSFFILLFFICYFHCSCYRHLGL